LEDYRTREGMQNITLDELRTRFFLNILAAGPAPRRTLITAFIFFVAEWPYRARQFDLIEEGFSRAVLLALISRMPAI
jgi:hypothetical protein